MDARNIDNSFGRFPKGFQKVPARLTSQRCICCGNIGSRNGKQFSCQHCGLQLDSDLNATRNVAKYQKQKIPIL